MSIIQRRQSQHALGGTATIGIVADDLSPLDDLFRSVWHKTFVFERQFSRFLPSSELTLFNQSAGVKKAVSPEFAAILRSVQSFGSRTNGLYNPFVLPAVQRTGYHSSGDAPYTKDIAADYTNRTVVSWEKLVVGDDWARIPYNTAIDLGGIGKGYLADMLGEHLRSCGVIGYWIELSGDIATFGHDENGQAFTVAVKDAEKQGSLTELITCPFTPFGIATSGTFHRIALKDTVVGHHIIDPATRQPAKTDTLLATICADTATTADVFASCAIIIGSKLAPAWLKKHDTAQWVIQTNAGRVLRREPSGTYQSEASYA